MNNSFARLIDGMTEALRQEVIPHVEGEFARGQVFGVIFVLNNLKLRAGWSPAFLGEQIAALGALAEALAAVPNRPADMPAFTVDAEDRTNPTEATRDRADGQVAALIDWLGQAETTLTSGARVAIDTAVDAYLKRQIRHEIVTSAKPMFAEISLGREQTEEAAR